MPNIGPLELAIVLIIALIIFGPRKLPELGRSAGRGIREFKNSVTGDANKEDADAKRAELEASQSSDPKQEKAEPVEGEVVSDRKA